MRKTCISSLTPPSDIFDRCSSLPPSLPSLPPPSLAHTFQVWFYCPFFCSKKKRPNKKRSNGKDINATWGTCFLWKNIELNNEAKPHPERRPNSRMNHGWYYKSPRTKEQRKPLISPHWTHLSTSSSLGNSFFGMPSGLPLTHSTWRGIAERRRLVSIEVMHKLSGK